jgi:hypothetical protein
MILRERFLAWRVRRCGLAAVRADLRAARADERLREAVRRFAELKTPSAAPLKALWPAPGRRAADYRP